MAAVEPRDEEREEGPCSLQNGLSGLIGALRCMRCAASTARVGWSETTGASASTAGLESLVDALVAQADGDPTRVAIAIETPRGALVDLLVERGFAVYAINPKQLDRFRDRFTLGRRQGRSARRAEWRPMRCAPTARRFAGCVWTIRWSFSCVSGRDSTRISDARFARVANQLRDLVYRVAPHLSIFVSGGR